MWHNKGAQIGTSNIIFEETTMKIKDIMNHNIEVVTPAEGLRETIHKMRNLNIGAIPVCEGKRLIGMLTTSDIGAFLLAERRYISNDIKVRDIMTSRFQWCFEHQDIDEVVKKMEKTQLLYLPVVNREKILVGIVALDALLFQSHVIT